MGTALDSRPPKFGDSNTRFLVECVLWFSISIYIRHCYSWTESRLKPGNIWKKMGIGRKKMGIAEKKMEVSIIKDGFPCFAKKMEIDIKKDGYITFSKKKDGWKIKDGKKMEKGPPPYNGRPFFVIIDPNTLKSRQKVSHS